MMELDQEDVKKLAQIEELIKSLRSHFEKEEETSPTMGEILSDKIAKNLGSWRFLLWQLVILITYVFLNVYLPIPWDGYPFILLNLALSFQAAFTAPIILMAQNRADKYDRQQAHKAYQAIGNIESLIKILTEIDEVKK